MEEPKRIQYSSDNPVLNNPYLEPKFHYDTDVDGNVDYSTIINGRRPYGYDISIVPQKAKLVKALFTQEDFSSNNPNSDFINGIRKEVKTWRTAGYPKASRITKELLDFWFSSSQRLPQQRLFFCQQEAVETAVWLNEIADKDANMGNFYLRELQDRRHTVSNDDDDILPRTAFKMATGTGKTVVMAMLILYHYLNKKANPIDTRYADHFLVCAPGITIRDRLGVLHLDNSQRSNNYDRSDYYHQRGLIPMQFEKELGGLNSCITIINYQQFLRRTFSGKHASPLDGKRIYKDGKMQTQDDKEDYGVLLARILEKGVKGKRIVVINDEAHHCYLPKTDTGKLTADEKDEAKNDNDAARVWYEGLRQMKLRGYKLQQVYDLSATPYYLKGSGYPEYSLFPWVVSDFGLVDAIESGLVKIPYLPSYDNAKDLDEPKLRNIYQFVKDKLPKRGMKAQRKKDKEDNVDVKNMTVQAPNLPTLLNTALEQFYDDYQRYEKGLREKYEEKGTLFTAPPVMIVVCNNTTVSREVFRDIAGYKDGEDEGGNPRFRRGRFEEFSNYDSMGMPKAKFPSLLIDSAVLDDASTTIDEDFKRAYKQEIDEFKKEYAIAHGAGAADNICDADILREVVNTVGKSGKLGGQIKCVVSVSMLTEGWDANTVTHVCGIRAFGSQLLCEQVVGRALRRQSYDMIPYDLAGKEIDRKKLSRYKPENITYKFPPEYARIIGVPFNTFKGGATVVTPPVKPKHVLRALKERAELEIRFPVITGYRSENVEGKLEADFTDIPKFQLDFNKIPTETVLQTVVNSDKKIMQVDCLELRDQEVIYYLSRLVIRELYTRPKDGPQFQKFPDVRRIVEAWYRDQLEIIGGDGKPEQKRLVILWNYKAVIGNIQKGIHQANAYKEKITAILNYYNPEGSTSHVFRPTNRSVIETTKSHVNYVIAEQGSGMEQAVKVLEANKQVLSYVKNTYLDFRIPYTVSDDSFTYQPDFIAKVKGKSESEYHLIIELSGFDNDHKGYKAEKSFALKSCWLPAANNLENFGKWELLEINNVDELNEAINQKIEKL